MGHRPLGGTQPQRPPPLPFPTVKAMTRAMATAKQITIKIRENREGDKAALDLVG
jgi:hypothetical protein